MGTPMYRADESLLEWATDKQAEYIKAINKHKGIRPAARALGVNFSTLNQSLRGLEKKAAIHGYSPRHDLTKAVAPGFLVKGHSTAYDMRKPGAPAIIQWVKTDRDKQAYEDGIKAGIAALLEDTPRARPIKAPAVDVDALCNLYTLTDCHVGMRAWGKETGADWDLEIAERTLTGAFVQMVKSSPAATTGIVAQLGDWLHFDGMSPITPMSGHVLDADSRYSKVVGVSVRILRAVIDCALSHHGKVVVLMAEGNHDLAGSVWLRHMFALLYENEPRVTVIDSELPYYVHQHGETLIAWHHGHLSKLDQLPPIFAAQFPREWGNTTYRYCHTGHLHHTHEKEHPGMTVIQHPTIAARDAYAARGGWIAHRLLTSITYHVKHGQVARTTVTPEMVQI